MLGLTLAHLLGRRGRRVTVIEGADRLGGLASAWRLGDVVWDRHYHVILASDARLRALLAELGLEREIRWVETRTGCYAGGRLYSVSDTVDFLRLPVLGLIDKLRLGATMVYGSRIRNGRRLERVLASDWLIRWSGRRTFERFWLPLLRSKLGENHTVTSAAFIWAVIARLYSARRTGLKKEVLGYVPGGYARVLEHFARCLGDAGVGIVLGRRVERVEGADGRVRVRFSDGESQAFDRAVVTLPAPLAVRVCRGLSSDVQSRLQSVRYLGVVCASLLLDRPLAGYYVTNILDDGVPFTGIIEMSALVDRERFGGRALVYLPRYVSEESEFFWKSDPEVEELFLAALERMYPAFRRDHVLAFRISRVRQVLALSTLNYSDRLPPIRTSVPGLYVVNSAQIVNGTLNVNETIELAEQAVATLVA
jgi:protoporphyrinogen oxidase